MKLGRIFVLLAAGMVAACQPSPAKSGFPERGAASASSSTHEGAQESKSLDIAATELTNDKGDLVLLKTLGGASPWAVLVVRYRSPGSSSNPKGCSLSVVEEIAGQPKIVASSEKLLACSYASSLEGVRESISADVKGIGAITVSEQLVKSTSDFTIERHPKGDWFITGLKFNHPENNLESGYVDVVSETVTYPLNAKIVRVMDYEYDKVRHDLVKTVIE